MTECPSAMRLCFLPCDQLSTRLQRGRQGWTSDSPSAPVYALAKRAVEGDLGEGALENGELLVVQLREE